MANYKATLVNGETYVYDGIFFYNGQEAVITEAQKEYLEANAYIRHKSPNRVFEECRFEFEETDEGSAGPRDDLVVDDDEDEDEVEAKPKQAAKKTPAKKAASKRTASKSNIKKRS